MIRYLSIRFLSRADAAMTLALTLLLATSVFFIYSAGYRGEDLPGADLYQKQIWWAALGLLLYVFFALTDYHLWIRLAWWFYGAGIVLLVLVAATPFGLVRYGARRWLDLGPVQMQPSELVKLAVVLTLSRFLGEPGRLVERTRYALGALALAGLPMLLIIRQPDLGTAMIFPPVALTIMFVAGAPIRVLRRIALLGVLAVILLAAVLILPPHLGCDPAQCDRLARLTGLSPYQRDRILVFFNSDLDPLGAGWNKAQSQIAVGSGRFWGKGYLNGTQNLLGFLPRTVAPTDFIFSVIAEETGFVGSAFVLFLYAVIVFSGMRAAVFAADKFGRLLCAGIMATLFCHVFINVAMTVGLMPITGLPLPLVSYGGTFMVVTMAALGMVQNVCIQGRLD